MEINEIESKKTVEKIKETSFFKNIKKIDKSLARLSKKQKNRSQITKLITQRGDMISDITQIYLNYKMNKYLLLKKCV